MSVCGCQVKSILKMTQKLKNALAKWLQDDFDYLCVKETELWMQEECPHLHTWRKNFEFRFNKPVIYV